jgi:hypothetical protein
MTSPNSFLGKGRTNKTNWGNLVTYRKTIGSLVKTPGQQGQQENGIQQTPNLMNSKFDEFQI